MQSIEHALRSLDKVADDERERTARAEKMLGDFQEQAGRPFEHEARLKELLARQAELNAALDLDKGERQIAPPDHGEGGPEGSEAEGTAGQEAAAAVRRESNLDRRREPPGRGGDRDPDGQDRKATVPRNTPTLPPKI